MIALVKAVGSGPIAAISLTLLLLAGCTSVRSIRR